MESSASIDPSTVITFEQHTHWEHIGLRYMDELLTRFLFQYSKNRRVKLCDLVHDLAPSVASDECSTVAFPL